MKRFYWVAKDESGSLVMENTLSWRDDEPCFSRTKDAAIGKYRAGIELDIKNHQEAIATLVLDGCALDKMAQDLDGA